MSTNQWIGLDEVQMCQPVPKNRVLHRDLDDLRPPGDSDSDRIDWKGIPRAHAVAPDLRQKGEIWAIRLTVLSAQRGSGLVPPGWHSYCGDLLGVWTMSRGSGFGPERQAQD